MLKLGCCSHLSMSDEQFDSLPERMRRNLFERVYFVDTPRYSYCLGARGELWTLVRCERYKYPETRIIIDEWR